MKCLRTCSKKEDDDSDVEVIELEDCKEEYVVSPHANPPLSCNKNTATIISPSNGDNQVDTSCNDASLTLPDNNMNSSNNQTSSVSSNKTKNLVFHLGFLLLHMVHL